MKEKTTYTLIRRSFLTIFALFCLVPVFWLIVTSFKELSEYYQAYFFPKGHWFFENYYRALIERGIYKYYLLSIILVIICVSSTILIALLSAYALTRLNFKYEKIIITIFLIIMMLPPQLGLVPLFLMFSKLHLLGNPSSLVFPYIISSLPLGLFLIYTYIKTIPYELDESAKMDGASNLTILFKIIVPIAKPMISTVVIISSMNVWNEYLLASTFLDNKWMTLSVAVVRSTKANVINNHPLNLATVILGFLPLLILFIALQKQFISGLTNGAVKS